MESIKDLVEYYDELFPCDSSVQNFYTNLLKKSPAPGKVLSIGSNTGTLEFFLARLGADVTGTEIFQPLLDSSLLKRRTQLLSIRFFKLSITEMSKYLGKHFYDIISCLYNRITYIYNPEKLQQFFYDCKEMISPTGRIVLQVRNIELMKNKTSFEFEPQKSLRSTLTTKISKTADGHYFLSQTLENSSGKILPILQNEEVYPLTKAEIIRLAGKAGFTNFEFYSDFRGSAFTEDSDKLVAVIS